MGVRFAELETKLGEIDRARAIFAHTSQICDPRVKLYYSFTIIHQLMILLKLLKQVSAEFWAAWKDFEVRHGNEDTIREMLRVKRSVQAMYNTQFTAHLIAQQTQLSGAGQASGESTQSAMKAVEAAAVAAMEIEKPMKRPDQVSFVKGDTLMQTHDPENTAANPDEINLDEDDDEDKGTIIKNKHF
jgi:pre-mRNA-splicing factor SYF1